MNPDVEEIMRVHFPKELRKVKFQLFMERFYLWRRFAGRWRYQEPYARVYHPMVRSLSLERPNGSCLADPKHYERAAADILSTPEDADASLDDQYGVLHARILPPDELTEEEQERIMERYANDMAKVRPQDENP